MSQKYVENTEFLDLVLGGNNELVLLPHEQRQVKAAYDKNVADFQEIVESKISVSGGDDWHDGAFRTTDNEAKIAAERNAVIAPYLGAIIVGYPEESESRVTLGSRVMLRQNGFTFPVDVVGFRQGYPDDAVEPETQEEIVGVSPESPLGRAIIGKEAGATAEYRNGNRLFKAMIEQINQQAVKLTFDISQEQEG